MGYDVNGLQDFKCNCKEKNSKNLERGCTKWISSSPLLCTWTHIYFSRLPFNSMKSLTLKSNTRFPRLLKTIRFGRHFAYNLNPNTSIENQCICFCISNIHNITAQPGLAWSYPGDLAGLSQGTTLTRLLPLCFPFRSIASDPGPGPLVFVDGR